MPGDGPSECYASSCCAFVVPFACCCRCCRRSRSPPATRAAAGLAVETQGGADAGADLERGRRLIEQYQCGRCHVVPGVAAARGRLAVPLDAMGARSYIAGRIPNRQDTLTQWIVDPPSLVPGTAMPTLGVSTGEAHHMAAYLGSLR